MNCENLQQAVDGYRRGERILCQRGSFLIEQGFTVFPVSRTDLDLFPPQAGRIFKCVTPDEAAQLADSPYCTNREAILAFLARLQEERA